MIIRKPLLYIVFILLLLIACTQENKMDKEYASVIVKSNKIFSKFSLCDSNANKEFIDFLGLKISADYRIIDTTSSNFNTDDIPDYVVILSPAIQEDDLYKVKCYNEKYNKRILLLLLSSPNGYFIQIVSENLILNKDESQSEPFRKIIRTKEGFGLSYFVGSSIKCLHDFYFRVDKGSFYLDSSVSDCYKSDLSKSSKVNRDYTKSDSTEISNIDIRKYLIVPELK